MEGVVRAALHPGSRAEWDVYQFLKDLDKELVECAQQDLRDAECFHELQVYIWGCDDWLPEASDPHLFRLVALLYLSSLLKGNAAELCACASSAGVTEEALSALVNFFSSLLQPLPAGALSNDGTMLALDAVEEDWQREHPGKLRTIVAKVVRSTYFLSPPRRDADGPSCATSLATLRSRIKEARARGDEADRLEAVECEVTKLYKEGYVPVEVADWENVYRSSLGAVLGYTGVGEIDRTEDLEAEGEREPGAWRWRHVTNIEFKELLSAVQESKLLLHLVTRRPPHSVFLSHRLAVYFCVTHARLWLERSPTFPFAAFRNISYDCLARDGTIFEAEVEDPNEAEEGEDPDIEAEEVEDPSRAIEAAEEVVLQSPLGYLERVPSFVESLQRKEALSLLYEVRSEDTGGAFVYPLPSPQCPTVLVPCCLKSGRDVWQLHRYPGSAHGLVLAIHRTFWYETKLQVFVTDEALRSKYSNITSFLDFVVEDHRPASLAERMGFVATCKTKDEKEAVSPTLGLDDEVLNATCARGSSRGHACLSVRNHLLPHAHSVSVIPSLDTDFEGKLPSLSDTEFSKDSGSYLEKQWPNIWKYVCGGLLVALSIFASQGWGGPQCVCT